jgi:hypothetical protein
VGGVGKITDVSEKPKAVPAPDEQVWLGGLRWIEGAQMQLLRFENAFSEWLEAHADAEFRQQLNDGSEGSQTWRESMDRDHPPYDPSRPLRVPSWGLSMQVANELDLLSVAVRNVLRAQDRMPPQQRPQMSGQDILELLRNVSEHWDEEGGRSVTTLATAHPGISPEGIAFTNKEIWIGGEKGIPVSRIRAWLGRVRTALVTALADVGIAVPDGILASAIEGDDDLPWPPERLRYHWSIPQVSEQEWPRERMPTEVADLLAEKFARLRTRDPED